MTMAQGDGSITGLVREKSGKELPVPAVKFLRAAEGWFDAKASTVDAGELYPLCGRTTYWGYNNQPVRLHPPGSPPQNAGEFLACLSLAAGKLGIKLPNPVPAAVDQALVQRISFKWHEAEELRKWRDQLSGWVDSQPEAVCQAKIRLRLLPRGAVLEWGNESGEFIQARRNHIEPLINMMRNGFGAQVPLETEILLRAATDYYGGCTRVEIDANTGPLVESLSRLLSGNADLSRGVVGEDGNPLRIADAPLQWRLTGPASDQDPFYRIDLTCGDGKPVPPPVALLPGRPWRYVTAGAVYTVDSWPFGRAGTALPLTIPARALETSHGVSLLRQLDLPMPAAIALRVRVVKPSVVVEAHVTRPNPRGSEYLRLHARTEVRGGKRTAVWTGTGWERVAQAGGGKAEDDGMLTVVDKAPLEPAAAWLTQLNLRRVMEYSRTITHEMRINSKNWAAEFSEWLARRPEDCEIALDGELASLAGAPVSGTLRLDIEESPQGIDWFDLRVALHVSDTELTEVEIGLLLKSQGRWVRIAGKGWRRLDLEIGEEQHAELAALGLSAHEFTAETQRLHAMQLGAIGGKGASLLRGDRAERVRRRIEEIKTRVAPQPPAAITAQLRPYQVEGFHFLAYLTENNFGGVLADDMGLGKTLQALTWIAWLREEKRIDGPVLVVCPKSVQDNWRQESGKFYPGLKVEVWGRASAGQSGLDGSADMLVIHYAQMRNHAEVLQGRKWGAVIIDEAQAVKNPASQNARTACSLVAAHRLALTGTPIENRLMDLWSIFAFAMPGVLGTRASFARTFERKDDPLARRRLAARTRPFLLRRTKQEVERELPARVEEDLVMEFDGLQADLYKAELKHARAQLLNVRTSRQLDKVRFNILTSLLRLRQICCHPQLVGIGGEGRKRPKHKAVEPPGDEAGAKLPALLETLEPIMEEGQKVLVFSQFVRMLEIIETELAGRKWRTFKLTGDTEDRGPLVESFQKHDGPAVFLISLKAGGTGLNLTAASYVVLFDPWWNPAVEAQAIDRTHRIGQKNTVFAYRLLIKGTIEEKIRRLQRHKGALARDILGEENFAKALTLEDFRFLLGDDGEDGPAPARS